MSKQAYKAGDLVRVSGASRTSPRRLGTIRHHLKPGCVACVHRVENDSTVWVLGVDKDNGTALIQGVRPGQLKPAKQAMKKRALYGDRRG